MVALNMLQHLLHGDGSGLVFFGLRGSRLPISWVTQEEAIYLAARKTRVEDMSDGRTGDWDIHGQCATAATGFGGHPILFST